MMNKNKEEFKKCMKCGKERREGYCSDCGTFMTK